MRQVSPWNLLRGVAMRIFWSLCVDFAPYVLFIFAKRDWIHNSAPMFHQFLSVLVAHSLSPILSPPDTAIGDYGAQMLSEALFHNSTLQGLCVDSMPSIIKAVDMQRTPIYLFMLFAYLLFLSKSRDTDIIQFPGTNRSPTPIRMELFEWKIQKWDTCILLISIWKVAADVRHNVSQCDVITPPPARNPFLKGGFLKNGPRGF